MGLLEKLFDLLLKKNWILLLISFVVGIGGIILFPDFYDKLPFSNKNINFSIGIACNLVAIFIVLYAILHVINKVRNCIRQKQQKRNEEATSLLELNQSIEEFKCYFDSISELDYNIVMQLIEDRNSKALILKGNIDSNILSREDLFYIVRSQEELIIIRSEDSKSIPIPQMQNVLHVKLKQDAYDFLSQIISSTGGLTHIAKERFLVGEYADE